MKLLDTGAEINVMTRKIIEDLKLAIRQRSKLKLVLYTGYCRPFLDFCENIEIVIGGLKTRHFIFIVEHRDYNLVFVQLFFNMVKFS